MQLIPRMMCDAEQVGTPVVLCEAEVFRCIKCNAPFAPKADGKPHGGETQEPLDVRKRTAIAEAQDVPCLPHP